MISFNEYTLKAIDYDGNIDALTIVASNETELERKYEEKYGYTYESYSIVDVEYDVFTDDEEEAGREYDREHRGY